MSDIVTTRGLSVRYGGNVALQPLDLSVPASTVVTVIGSNGAGKTTLLGALAGWSRGKPVVTGRVELDGQDITGASAARRARAGVTLVPESSSVFPGLTVQENLTLGRRRRGQTRFGLEEVYQLLPALAELRGRAAGSLSGGQRQMLAIARALRAEPRLLLLDEPSIGLAPQVITDILRFVRGLVDQGVTVLLSEQNVTAVMDISDELILIERGAVVTRGTPAQLRDDRRLLDAYLGNAS